MAGGSAWAEKQEILYGTATGIGSLPHYDAEAALRLIFEYFPEGPHWPQLPACGREEGFARQYLCALERLGLIQTEEGEEPPFFCDRGRDWPEKLASFYSLCLEAEGGDEESLQFFAFPPEAAAGFYAFLERRFSAEGLTSLRFVKGQISGPLSLGLQVNGGDRIAAFYRSELREVIVRNLALIARWQVRVLKRFFSSVLIFIDEPALLSYGQSTYISLSREDIKTSLLEIVRAVKLEGAYVGVHCCSGGDWSILLDLPLDVINFDAYSYLPSLLVYSEELEKFLRRGGCLAWGLVPTAPEIEAADGDALQRMFSEGIGRLIKKGVTGALLREQYMLTPSCGAATLTVDQAERVYRLTAEMQKRLAKK